MSDYLLWDIHAKCDEYLKTPWHLVVHPTFNKQDYETFKWTPPTNLSNTKMDITRRKLTILSKDETMEIVGFKSPKSPELAMYLTRDNDGVLNKYQCERMTNELARFIARHAEVAIIGLSGGADSTLVAAVSVMALGKENVYGYSMPYGKKDAETFNARSALIATKLDINHKTVDISTIADAIVDASDEEDFVVTPLVGGNARARARMTVLYSKAAMVGNKTGKLALVMGTGQLSEDYIGYCTKYGDSGVDLLPIAKLYKQEVYDLLDYFKGLGVINETHIDRIPSAGLWEGQSDEAELGFSYNDMAPVIEMFSKMDDRTLAAYIDNNKAVLSPIAKFVVKRFVANKHKNNMPLMCENLR